MKTNLNEGWEKQLEIFDFPTAWRLVELTAPELHHEKCSWRVSVGAILCDCVGMEIARFARNDLKSFLAQEIAEAERKGYEKGIEQAIKETKDSYDEVRPEDELEVAQVKHYFNVGVAVVLGKLGKLIKSRK